MSMLSGLTFSKTFPETHSESRSSIPTMRRLLLYSILPAPLPVAHAEEAISPEHLDYFETHVRPALVKYCYECHSVESGDSRGGLFLDSREAMRAGGSTGPLFDDENWEYSLFVDAVTWNDPDFEMPPKNKMPDDVIDALRPEPCCEM